jgi:hypothetical protein
MANEWSTAKWVLFGIIVIAIVAVVLYCCIAQPGIRTNNSLSPISPTGEPFSPSCSASSNTITGGFGDANPGFAAAASINAQPPPPASRPAANTAAAAAAQVGNPLAGLAATAAALGVKAPADKFADKFNGKAAADKASNKAAADKASNKASNKAVDKSSNKAVDKSSNKAVADKAATKASGKSKGEDKGGIKSVVSAEKTTSKGSAKVAALKQPQDDAADGAAAPTDGVDGDDDTASVGSVASSAGGPSTGSASDSSEASSGSAGASSGSSGSGASPASSSSGSSTSGSGLSEQSQELLDCQNAALDSLQACQAAANGDPTQLDNCWQQIHQQLAACVPSSAGAPVAVTTGSLAAVVLGAAALIFNESVPISDRLDSAIENYLQCMASSSTDRQSCVEQLLTDVNASVDTTQLSSDQQSGFTQAINDLVDCLQQSTSIEQDFICLRTLYATIVDTLKISLIPLPNKAKRVYATNKAIATNCYQQATATLRQCLESIKNIADPKQRDQAKQLCLKEYRELLNSCLCLSFGPNDPRCQKQT